MIPPDDPVNLTPEGFVPVPSTTCTSLEQIAAAVEAHDGITPAEILLAGTGFVVRLGQRRPFVSVFSEKEKRKFSAVELEEFAAKNDLAWFGDARAAAGKFLREAGKEEAREARKKKRKPAAELVKSPPLWEETLLRRQLAEAQGVTAATRRDLETARRDLDAARRRVVELEEGGLVEQVKELEEQAELLEEERDGLRREVAELEGELETMRNSDDQRVAGMDLVESLADQLAVDYFRDNFRSIPLAALEWIVAQQDAAR